MTEVGPKNGGVGMLKKPTALMSLISSLVFAHGALAKADASQIQASASDKVLVNCSEVDDAPIRDGYASLWSNCPDTLIQWRDRLLQSVAVVKNAMSSDHQELNTLCMVGPEVLSEDAGILVGTYVPYLLSDYSQYKDQSCWWHLYELERDAASLRGARLREKIDSWRGCVQLRWNGNRKFGYGDGTPEVLRQAVARCALQQ